MALIEILATAHHRIVKGRLSRETKRGENIYRDINLFYWISTLSMI